MRKARLPIGLPRGGRILALMRLELLAAGRRWPVLLGLASGFILTRTVRVLVHARIARQNPELAPAGTAFVQGLLLEPFMWALLATMLFAFESLREARNNREMEPILASGMTDVEILMGKTLPAAALSLAVGVSILSVNLWLGIRFHHAAVACGRDLLGWGLLYLPGFCLGAAVGAVSLPLWFRTQTGVILLVIPTAGSFTFGVQHLVSRSPRWPLPAAVTIWVLFSLLAIGSIRWAGCLLRRDRCIVRP